MQFQKWVEKKGGSRAVGKLMGINATTVYAWVVKKAVPRPLKMQRLVQIGAGRLTYASIIKDTMPVRRRVKKSKKKISKKKAVKRSKKK